MSDHLGDLLVLVGLVLVFFIARRKGKNGFAAAIAQARASGHAEATASAAAAVRSDIRVNVGNGAGADGIGSGEQYATLVEIVRAELRAESARLVSAELSNGLRAVRHDSGSIGNVGRLPEFAIERPSEVGNILGALAPGGVGVRRADADDSPALNGRHLE